MQIESGDGVSQQVDWTWIHFSSVETEVTNLTKESVNTALPIQVGGSLMMIVVQSVFLRSMSNTLKKEIY